MQRIFFMKIILMLIIIKIFVYLCDKSYFTRVKRCKYELKEPSLNRYLLKTPLL